MGELVTRRVEGVAHVRSMDGSPHPPSITRYSFREDGVKVGVEVEWEKARETVTSERASCVVLFT
jgi:hypothetical protein